VIGLRLQPTAVPFDGLLLPVASTEPIAGL